MRKFLIGSKGRLPPSCGHLWLSEGKVTVFDTLGLAFFIVQYSIISTDIGASKDKQDTMVAWTKYVCIIIKRIVLGYWGWPRSRAENAT